MKLRDLTAALAGAAAMGAIASAQSLDLTVDEINANLRAAGIDAELAYAEIISTDPDEGEASRVVFFNDRGNRQLSNQFVVNDSRRAAWSGDPNTIDWSLSAFFPSADMTIVEQDAAIGNAMQTWDNQTCSEYGLNGGGVPVSGPFIGGPATADIMHSGFLPASFFINVFGSPNILGVHLGFLFIDPATGAPTDIDGNGLLDKAFGDIYYNDGFTWSTDATPGTFDYETVALHEAGHGHSQGHFGSAFTNKSGKVKFNPRAVMNATYSGVQRELAGTDNAGHCSLWAQWPNN